MHIYMNTIRICMCTDSLHTQSYFHVNSVYTPGTGVIAWLYWSIQIEIASVHAIYTHSLTSFTKCECLKYSEISLIKTQG